MHQKSVIKSDFDFLLGDFRSVARGYEQEEIYLACHDNPKKAYENLRIPANLKDFEYSIKNLTIYESNKKCIEKIRNMGYEFHVLTDNFILGLPETQRILMKRIHVDKIETTYKPIIRNGICTVEYIKDKISYFDDAARNNSDIWVIIEGENDIPLAKHAHSKGAQVVIVGNNCKNLEHGNGIKRINSFKEFLDLLK